MPVDLPIELEREIFQLALRSNRDDAAVKLALSLVARRVQFWSVHPATPNLTILNIHPMGQG